MTQLSKSVVGGYFPYEILYIYCEIQKILWLN